MREQSIVQAIAQLQADGDEIYCPMCEAWHIDDTWCQFPGWED